MIYHEGTKDRKDTKVGSAIQHAANAIPQNLDIEIEEKPKPANEQAFVTFVAFVPSW